MVMGNKYHLWHTWQMIKWFAPPAILVIVALALMVGL